MWMDVYTISVGSPRLYFAVEDLGTQPEIIRHKTKSMEKGFTGKDKDRLRTGKNTELIIDRFASSIGQFFARLYFFSY